MNKAHRLEVTMELINDAINSALKQQAHFEPSPRTLELLEEHKDEDARRFEEAHDKLERMQDTLDEIKGFMERALPVIEAYEDTLKDGKRILWLAGFITAVGGAWLVLTKIFKI